jgi:PAS domain S-box-containing protein
MDELRRSWTAQYGVAVVAAGLALLLQMLLVPWFGGAPNQSPFMIFFIAVMVASWFGGLGPGLLATTLSALLSWYFLLSPQYSFAIDTFGQGLRIIVFVLEGVVISSLVEALYSARRRAERALKAKSQSEVRFRLLVEGVKDYAIFMLDPEGYVMTWNEGAQRIKGYEAQEIIGEHFSVFYTDEDVEREHPEEELRIAAAHGSYEEEGVRVRKDGSTFWASVLITALRDEEGGLCGFAKVTRDITERKEAESALSEVREAERHQLARDLHDGVMQEQMDLLYSMQVWRLRLAEEGEYLPEIDQRIDDLRGATQALRDTLNTLRQGNVQQQPFVYLLRSVVAANRQKAPQIEISLALDPSFSLEPSGSTGIDILRIIQEALVNVRRHAGAHRIWVNLWAEGEYLNVEVVDDGRGFDAEIDTEATWGSIGIAAMRERARKLGGDLYIQSEPGKGTRVTARVPAAATFAADALAFRAFEE